MRISLTISAVCGGILGLCAGLPSLAFAAPASPPNFSGVYFRTQDPRLSADQAVPAAPLPNDGSRGRPANSPPLNAEYMAKYDIISKSRIAGSSEYDSVAKCLPPGMPFMMNMVYGMEIMQNPTKITMFSEWLDALRRIYLDGRKPTQQQLDDPTFAGFSTGHWEGDTLVVETVALRAESQLDAHGSPHSDAMTVHERIRFIAPDVLEDHMTITDAKALTKPWEQIRLYRKATPPKDYLREFACAEGLQLPEKIY